ncbi:MULTISPECIES: MarR family winged helix-turn-helix transcriptional regulator [Pseudobutyrivibrio]|jgi:DNA-binding MarR family transcriptional regulator|uniref:DNA-binding transcriptional regulator, MarR family n=1 Tax=Pseudobutyrivibrio ruminis DSM 9787 TaxID=1123011 RepID=A0A285SJ70_9FIRM|nr:MULTISPECIES: MarR family transcriptional regulator [Pseudobutyrivibrio]SET21252.1 DNA-binding transcriptional regulator, MarR family [Pseudobutyrivibrio sp. C4]SFN80365.1 DNA-binding transcriptional regulator, MarR family [Pseudobutyrivibrio sp. JW11]SOC07992.1 DNA-binding transcriptional regulator, MarR family [Pseudobutyrivibrio ruminis DSM 9787]
MLEEALTEVYTKFKVHFYQEMFKKLRARETSLTIVELFCVEIIYVLRNPTVKEFAEFIGISSPNAAYKIACLIDKGYIEKVQSEKDRREFHLHVTDKYLEYLNLSEGYVKTVAERAEERFTEERIETLNDILNDMSDFLMKEVDIPKYRRSEEE